MGSYAVVQSLFALPPFFNTTSSPSPSSLIPPTDLHQIALPWSDPKSGCECQVTVVERREIENRRETKNHTGEGGEQKDALVLSYNSFAINRSVLSGYYKLLVS